MAQTFLVPLPFTLCIGFIEVLKTKRQRHKFFSVPLSFLCASVLSRYLKQKDNGSNFPRCHCLLLCVSGLLRYLFRRCRVTFVLSYKSNQKNSWGYKHYATADGFYSARLIGTQTCIPITVTAIKAQQTYKFYLPPTDTHSDM